MTELERRVALAIKACTDKFESPVCYYVEPEARYRARDASADPDYDPWFDEPDREWELESYAIIARAAIAAMSK